MNLFLNPLPKPISKKLNQPIIELTVNQIPYSIGDTKSKVIGTKMKLTPMFNPFVIIEIRIFFFTEKLLSLLVRNLFFMSIKLIILVEINN